MAMAEHYKSGEITKPSAEVAKVAGSMSHEQLHDFAATKEKGLKYHGKGRSAHA